MNDEETRVVEAVYAALADQDHEGLRRLLHPFLHWAGPDGVTVRGRTKMLALIDEQQEPPERPAAVELRDGQVYRWQSG